MSQPIELRTALRDALLAGGVALLLFAPITGMLLNGYELDYAWERPLTLAAIVFVGRLLFALSATTPVGRRWLAKLHPDPTAGIVVASVSKQRKQLVLLAGLIALGLPFLLGKYWLNVAILAMIYILLGLGLNIVVGLAGLLDLGFVAFYAVGAYGYALGSQYLGLNFWEAIPFCAVLAASFGALLGFPVLRMHGDYLAIVTLGFGEIIRLVLNNWMELTGGPNGISVPFPTLFGLEFTRRAKAGGVPFHEYFNLPFAAEYRVIFIYLALLAVIGLMLLTVTRLRRMPIGRTWEALREDEIACRSLGINHVTVKLSAFSLGAMVGGVAGVFFAGFQGFINPSSFSFHESAMILAIVVLGGLGSTIGVVVAAITLTVMPELFRPFADYRVLIFGVAMVLMMIWRPRGLLRIRRERFVNEAAS